MGIWEFLDTGLKLILGDSKCHCDPLSGVETDRGHRANAVLVGLDIHPISPIPECVIGMDMFCQFCEIKAIMVAKVKWKLLVLTIPRKIVSQKQFCVPGGIVEVTASIKDLKNNRH